MVLSSWAQALVAVVAVAAGLMLSRTLQRRRTYDLHRLPGPKGYPVIGNMLDIIGGTHMHKFIVTWSQRLGSIWVWYMMGQPIVVCTDPAEWARLLAGGAGLPKWTKFYDIIEPESPRHYSLVGTQDLEYHRHVRRTINVAFSQENLRKRSGRAGSKQHSHLQMFPYVVSTASKAAEALSRISQQSQAPIDVDNVMMRVTADIISTAAFADDFKTMTMTATPDGQIAFADHPYFQRMKKALDEAVNILGNPLYGIQTALPWTAASRRNKSLRELSLSQDRELLRRVRARGVQPESNTELWACFTRLQDLKHGGPMHETDAYLNLGFTFAAGFETTAHSVAWALFEIAAHPEVQERLAAELDAAGLLACKGPPGRALDFADLGKLPYVEAVVKESLRMHPTAPLGSNRILPQDMTVCGYRLPTGTAVMFAPIALHRSPLNFPRPEDFVPERWLDAAPAGDLKAIDMTGNGAAWAPFMCGARNCAGQALAKMEAAAVLATLSASLLFSLPAGVQREQFLKAEQVFRITLQPKDGMYLHCKPRA